MTSRWLLLFFLSSLLISCSGSTADPAAGQPRQGGDSAAAQFAAIGNHLVSQIGTLSADKRHGITPAQLAAAIDKTQVNSTDQALDLGGGTRLVDAISYPDRALILLSRPNWGAMDCLERQRLVLHEYSSILSLDDTNYQISAKVLLSLGQVGPDPIPSADPIPDPSSSPYPYPDPFPSGCPAPDPAPSWSPSG